MKISQLVQRLNEIQAEHGDLLVGVMACSYPEDLCLELATAIEIKWLYGEKAVRISIGDVLHPEKNEF